MATCGTKPIADYSANATETQLDDPGDQLSRDRYFRHNADYTATASRLIGAVGEDRGFYIPEVVTEEAYRSNPDLFAAAFGHAENLSDVQRLLGEAQDLIRTLSDLPVDDRRAEATQCSVTRLKIEKKLRDASTRLVKHGRRHTNLFLVYFDLRGRMGAAAGSSAPARKVDERQFRDTRKTRSDIY